MKKKIVECPQIRYHISYDKNLSLKDLEDLINLIRISNNDALQEMGISRSKGNDLQRIEKIQPGSIDIVTVLSVVSSVITIGSFVYSSSKAINKNAEEEYNKNLRGTKRDKKLHNRSKITVQNNEDSDIYIDNSFTVHIHVNNEDDIRQKLETFLPNDDYRE